jgi:hypothetical protein
MTMQNLGFDGAEVLTIAFQPGSVRLWFREGGTYLEALGLWQLTWPDGSVSDYDTASGGRHPDTARLIDALAESHVVSAEAEVETSILDVEFDTGLKLHFEPTNGPYEEWEARNHDDRLYIALPSNELTWTLGREEQADDPEEPEDPEPEPQHESGSPRWYEGTEPRLIDLELADRIYGVTLFAESLELLTRSGSLFFAGPFTVTESDSSCLEYDPRDKRTDATTGPILDRLIDTTIEAATLVPETSTLAIRLTDGGRLDWSAPSEAQGMFRVRTHDRREFWSKGDGTIYWYGGPEGTHPTFLLGGPRENE